MLNNASVVADTAVCTEGSAMASLKASRSATFISTGGQPASEFSTLPSASEMNVMPTWGAAATRVRILSKKIRPPTTWRNCSGVVISSSRTQSAMLLRTRLAAWWVWAAWAATATERFSADRFQLSTDCS